MKAKTVIKLVAFFIILPVIVVVGAVLGIIFTGVRAWRGMECDK